MSNVFKLRAKDYLDTPENKVIFNQEHFTESAPRYDLATRMLSLGQDSRWKSQVLRSLPNLETPSCLDLACGTGDLALGLGSKYPLGKVIGIDITEAMLVIARNRNQLNHVTFQNQNIAKLDFPNKSFDIITGGYALRNSPDIEATLAEIHRTLKPNGVAIILDFAKPETKILQIAQFYLLKYWGGFWGFVLHRNPEVHGYISASLKNYPKPSLLMTMIKKAGFSSITRKKLFLGMMEVIYLKK